MNSMKTKNVVAPDALESFLEENIGDEATVKVLDEETVELTYEDGSVGLLYWRRSTHGSEWDFLGDGNDGYAAGYAYAAGDKS